MGYGREGESDVNVKQYNFHGFVELQNTLQRK
jgi:hypothetical protein